MSWRRRLGLGGRSRGALGLPLGGVVLGLLAFARAQEAPPPATSPARSLSRSMARAVEAASPAQVLIRPASDPRRGRSGVVIAPGYVVTSALNVDVFGVEDLVVEDAVGESYPARLRGRDLRLRLVLLAVPELPAPPLQIAPPEARRVGAFLLALGTPLRRRSPTATGGILSATDRFQGRADQLDAAIDASNTGGAVVDLEGRLLGVAVHVHERLGARSGVGFYVPHHLILAALPGLQEGHELQVGSLGVVVPRFQAASAEGIEVVAVTPRGAAARAGIAKGDRILAVRGIATPDLGAFRAATAYLYAGIRAEIEFARGAERRKVSLIVLPRE